jgi:tight adherence protein B
MIDGAFIGLVAGIGLLLVWLAFWESPAHEPRHGPVARWLDRVHDDLIAVGLGSVPAGAVPAMCVGLGLAVMILIWSVSGATVPAAAIGAVVSVLPPILLRALARRRRTQLRELWPEVVDHMNSAIRAGMSLPEALAQVGRRGPEELRPPFEEFGRDYQVSGDFASSLDRLKDRLADPGSQTASSKRCG